MELLRKIFINNAATAYVVQQRNEKDSLSCSLQISKRNPAFSYVANEIHFHAYEDLRSNAEQLFSVQLQVEKRKRDIKLRVVKRTLPSSLLKIKLHFFEITIKNQVVYSNIFLSGMYLFYYYL